MNNIIVDWRWGIFEGIVLILFGWIAMAHPILTTWSLTVIVGSITAAAGAMLAWRAWQGREVSDFWIPFLTGLVVIGIGVILLYQPKIAMLSLTTLLLAYFILQGISNLLIGWQGWDLQGAGWFVLHGLASLAMAAILLSGWPTTALWFLGLLFGINLVFSGASLLTLSLVARKAEK